MATLTNRLSLRKPVPDSERDWGIRHNENWDILDDAALVANLSGAGIVSVDDDGSGKVTISGSSTASEDSAALAASGTLNAENIAAVMASGTVHYDNATIHFTEASIDHVSISNVGTNTHAQIDTHIADGATHFTEGSVDHGSIAGLSDDDHTQYALVNGTRSFTGGITAPTGTFTNSLTVSGVPVNIGAVGGGGGVVTDHGALTGIVPPAVDLL